MSRSVKKKRTVNTGRPVVYAADPDACPFLVEVSLWGRAADPDTALLLHCGQRAKTISLITHSDCVHGPL
jgi:hypothetical protein